MRHRDEVLACGWLQFAHSLSPRETTSADKGPNPMFMNIQKFPCSSDGVVPVDSERTEKNIDMNCTSKVASSCCKSQTSGCVVY